ncbi:MAG TPA: type II toxin-antitoxin system VapC family toxin [Chthoniobacterales bacterium]
MSRLLLDTHALIWIVRNDAALSKSAIDAFETSEEIFCSVASFWEIAIKRGKDPKSFPLPENWLELLTGEIRLNGMSLLGVGLSHCEAVERLPPHHKDPFDRMLIAQARTEKLIILTKDPYF